MFTPEEEFNKYIDQSCFENGSKCLLGIIREAFILPDNDLLLGITEIFEPVPGPELCGPVIDYYKLSELRISFNPEDTAYYLEENDYEHQ